MLSQHSYYSFIQCIVYKFLPLIGYLNHFLYIHILVGGFLTWSQSSLLYSSYTFQPTWANTAQVTDLQVHGTSFSPLPWWDPPHTHTHTLLYYYLLFTTLYYYLLYYLLSFNSSHNCFPWLQESGLLNVLKRTPKGIDNF